MFTFISSVQEEVHRYAITYHRTLKKKNTLSVSLSQINGIGEKRAAVLMARFKTLDAIKNAELDEIINVPGLTKEAAINVYEYFHR